MSTTKRGLVELVKELTPKHRQVCIFVGTSALRIETIDHWIYSTDRGGERAILYPAGTEMPDPDSLVADTGDSELQLIASDLHVGTARSEGPIPRLRGERIPHLKRGGMKSYGKRKPVR